MTFLYVYGSFQFERLADFMFTSAQPAIMAPRFISVGSELTDVLFGNNRNIYDFFCQMWHVITCKLPDALFKVSRWISVQLLLL